MVTIAEPHDSRNTPMAEGTVAYRCRCLYLWRRVHTVHKASWDSQQAPLPTTCMDNMYGCRRYYTEKKE